MINNSITIDLHGYSVHEGYELFNRKMATCYFAGASALIIITGNGQMSSEIETWAHNNQKVKKIRCTSRKGRGRWEVTLYHDCQNAKTYTNDKYIRSLQVYNA